MACMDKLDNRFGCADGLKAQISKEELQAYDVLFLAGGHVPTQNAFFHQLQLREKLAGFQGIIIGISAGSMNSSDVVYIQPEEPGEACSPDFCRWGTGLGLTGWMLSPHYQMVQDKILDGQRLYPDITLPDIEGKELLLLNDGSYLHIRKAAADGPVQKVSLYGESYLISQGKLQGLCEHEAVLELTAK